MFYIYLLIQGIICVKKSTKKKELYKKKSI